MIDGKSMLLNGVSQRPLTVNKRNYPFETSMTDPTLPQRLKARRLHLGVDQSVLAEAIDRSRPLITAMENGNSAITVDQIAAFAKVLRVPVGYFFGDQNGQPEAEAELQHAFRALSPKTQRLVLASVVAILEAETSDTSGQ